VVPQGDALDLAAYARRIGVRLPTAPTLRALESLHEAHVQAVPFENLDILLGRPIRLDLASLQAKLVAARRGGYCFEQNTLFAAVLEALGFPVTRLGARVGSRPDAITRRTHMALLVEVPEGAFLADVGFGGEGPVWPVPLDPAAPAKGEHRVAAGAEGLALHDRERSLYTFTLERQYDVDFEVANHFTATHPDSHFTRKLTAQRAWPGGRAILRDRELVVRRDGRDETTIVRDPEHLLAVLATEFGLAFPPGTRFAMPDF
jgi:N-hydroxyarylamine O-acetyltransferase